MAVGGGHLYVGADDGAVYVYQSCGGTGGFSMPALWSYGPLDGAVTSLVVDLRGADPVYATTTAGELVSLEIDGTLIWTFRAEAGISRAPVIDRQTRRIFFVDDKGKRYALDGDGTTAFDVTPAMGPAPATSLAFGTFDHEVDGVVRSLRTFYYGGVDGMIYLVQTDR
jgi:outer membrane protein assembly factor BamB